MNWTDTLAVELTEQDLLADLDPGSLFDTVYGDGLFGPADPGDLFELAAASPRRAR